MCAGGGQETAANAGGEPGERSLPGVSWRAQAGGQETAANAGGEPGERPLPGVP
jgi:hypothetical protein